MVRVSVFTMIIVLGSHAMAQGQIVLKQAQRFPVDPLAHFSLSPSETTVALVSRLDCRLYALDNDGAQWLGPYEGDMGGFAGTRSHPDSLGNKDSYSIARKKQPVFGWAVERNGDEVLVLDPVSGRTVELRGGAFRETHTAATVSVPTLRPLTGRLDRHQFRFRPSPTVEADLNRRYAELKSKAATDIGLSLPDELPGVRDFSPDGKRVLLRFPEDEEVVSFDVTSGKKTSYPIQNNRPRGRPDQQQGSFSPTGDYVIMEFEYGSDDNYSGGYYQLFTVDGDYLVEIGQLAEGVPPNTGFHEWLSSDWIIYSTGKEVVFQKVEVAAK